MKRLFPLVAAPLVIAILALAAVKAAEVQEGVLVAANNGAVVMTDIYGENMRSFMVAPNVRIMRDGSLAKLQDLKVGDRLLLTMRQQDRQNKVVIRIDAHSAG